MLRNVVLVSNEETQLNPNVRSISAILYVPPPSYSPWDCCPAQRWPSAWSTPIEWSSCVGHTMLSMHKVAKHSHTPVRRLFSPAFFLSAAEENHSLMIKSHPADSICHQIWNCWNNSLSISAKHYTDAPLKLLWYPEMLHTEKIIYPRGAHRTLIQCTVSEVRNEAILVTIQGLIQIVIMLYFT